MRIAIILTLLVAVNSFAGIVMKFDYQNLYDDLLVANTAEYLVDNDKHVLIKGKKDKQKYKRQLPNVTDNIWIVVKDGKLKKADDEQRHEISLKWGLVKPDPPPPTDNIN